MINKIFTLEINKIDPLIFSYLTNCVEQNHSSVNNIFQFISLYLDSFTNLIIYITTKESVFFSLHAQYLFISLIFTGIWYLLSPTDGIRSLLLSLVPYPVSFFSPSLLLKPPFALLL